MHTSKNISTNSSADNLFLTGVILFAEVDYSGYAEYALKAAIGGFIWFLFKVASEYVSQKFKKESEE